MKGVLTLLIGLISAFHVLGFQSEGLTIAKIDNHLISASEFLYAFKKNRSESQTLHIDSLKAYLDNYLNFKLKVLEAKALGYDTIENFRVELQGYLSQIRKPYLQNPEAEEKLIAETHRRMLIEIDASHLLIKVEPNASPQDTLKAYNFLDSLRNTVDSKENFEALAKRYSQDGSAPNGGSLGWFSAMDMVGPFENAAYQTSVNQVSEITKTQFGYHILFINRIRPSRGKLKTAHIFFSNQGRSLESAYKLAQSVYDSLKNGADWNTMARKYSDDGRTKMNGGQLPWARIKQLPDDFLDIAYTLKEVNDFSVPGQTKFGWHIVKLDDEEPIKPLTESRAEIEQQLKRSGRNVLNNDQLIKKLKIENDFRQDQASLTTYLNAISERQMSPEILESSLFQIGEKHFLVIDFVKTLPSHNIALNSSIISSLYVEFERESIIAYEDSIASQKYPEYGFLRQEYEDGLLLFEIMQQEVWNKAIEDSVGAVQYYQGHLEQYKPDRRAAVSVISSRDQSVLKKLISTPNSNSSLNDLIEKTLTDQEQGLLKIVKRTIKLSEISKFEPTEVTSGSWILNDNTSEYYFIEEIIPEGYFFYDEIKGQVLSDYQDFLEQQWIKELRAKRSIQIYNDTLEEIAKN